MLYEKRNRMCVRQLDIIFKPLQQSNLTSKRRIKLKKEKIMYAIHHKTFNTKVFQMQQKSSQKLNKAFLNLLQRTTSKSCRKNKERTYSENKHWTHNTKPFSKNNKVHRMHNNKKKQKKQYSLGHFVQNPSNT